MNPQKRMGNSFNSYISGKKRLSPAEYLKAVESNEIPAGTKVTFLIPGIDTDKPFGEFIIEEDIFAPDLDWIDC